MIASQPQKYSGSVKVVPAGLHLDVHRRRPLAARPPYFFLQSLMGPVQKHLVSDGNTSSAFTAGPWDHYDYGDKKYPTIKIEDDRGNPIAYIDRSDRGPAVSAANARLIARAPDLLNLARKLIVVCDDRLAELREESDQWQDSDITDRINHYVSLKHEAESCISEIL